ncbi:hypothetical protein ACHAXT_000222 [Thalassiosira profunda]
MRAPASCLLVLLPFLAVLLPFLVVPVNFQSASSADPSHPKQANITCNANGTCTDPVGVVGEWVYVGRNRSFASPDCCGLDDIQTGANGFEKRCRVPAGFNVELYHGDPDPVFPAILGGHACGLGCPGYRDEYVWHSPNLPWQFDATDTCRLLGNRTALLIGDSTMGQAAVTLMNALRFGHCQTQIYIGSSDTLVGRGYGGMNRGNTWRALVDRINPDIVVLTVGAHLTSASDATYGTLIDEILGEVETLQRERPTLRIAWKTQSPAGCRKQILEPKDAVRAARTLDFTRMVGEYGLRGPKERPWYNWDRFYQWDMLLLSKLQKAGIPYLDCECFTAEPTRTCAARSIVEIACTFVHLVHWT